MRKLTMAIGALLSGTLALSPFAATAFAAESKTLNITASSNFSPSVTQSIDSATKQITTTWWLQDAEDKMVNIQGILTYDNTKLSVDMSDGVNRTYDAENDEYIDNILCITNGKSTVVNYNPKSLPDGSNAGIRFNATEASGFSMGSATEKVPFFSVTFNPIDDAQGDTDVHLEVNYMAIRDENDTTYHKLIHKSEIVDKDAVYLPEEHAAIYEGPFDPNYTPAEPTTAEPTTVEPTTAEPTTAEPTTAAPTTVAPTTVAPTTIAPTTIAPTTEPLPVFILGDVNDDGKVDVSDATLVQMHAAEIITFDAIHCLAADVNKDGVADIIDVTLIQQFAAEVIQHF